jgi:phosphoglycolate phosphatase-like HAD superfamily hydrolase
MIGDTEKDLLAAKNANISSVIIKTHYNKHLPKINFINSLKDLI